MYCEIRGIDGGVACTRCGMALPPKSALAAADTAADAKMAEKKGPWPWNPDIAALLSWVLFSSIFGALVQAANWKRLGQKRRMWTSIAWSALPVVSFIVAIACFPMENRYRRDSWFFPVAAASVTLILFNAVS